VEIIVLQTLLSIVNRFHTIFAITGEGYCGPYGVVDNRGPSPRRPIEVVAEEDSRFDGRLPCRPPGEEEGLADRMIAEAGGGCGGGSLMDSGKLSAREFSARRSQKAD